MAPEALDRGVLHSRASGEHDRTGWAHCLEIFIGRYVDVVGHRRCPRVRKRLDIWRISIESLAYPFTLTTSRHLLQLLESHPVVDISQLNVIRNFVLKMKRVDVLKSYIFNSDTWILFLFWYLAAKWKLTTGVPTPWMIQIEEDNFMQFLWYIAPPALKY